MSTPKTIPARIHVAVWPDGRWTAYGDEGKHAERTLQELLDAAPGGESYHVVTVDLPLPQEIAGKVE
jgi:hypothetical protein